MEAKKMWGFRWSCGGRQLFSLESARPASAVTCTLKFWDMEAKKTLPPLFGDSWASACGEALPRLQGALEKGIV